MPAKKLKKPTRHPESWSLKFHDEDHAEQLVYVMRRWLRQPGIMTALLTLSAVAFVSAAASLVSLEAIEGNLRGRWTAAVAWAEEKTPVRVELASVEGLSRTQLDLVTEALGLPREMSPLAIDVDAWRSALEKLPWVAEASVRYIPMKHVSVRVVEHEPIAVWRREDGIWLVNERGGHIISASGAPPESLPLMAGEGADTAVGELAMLRTSHEELARPGTLYRRIGRRRWNIELEDGPVVMLPERGLELAASRLRQLLDRWHLTDREIVAVDLRSVDRIALRLAGGELERLVGEQPQPGVEL